MKKETIRDGSSSAVPRNTLLSLFTVYTVQNVLHYLSSSLYAYILVLNTFSNFAAEQVWSIQNDSLSKIFLNNGRILALWAMYSI